MNEIFFAVTVWRRRYIDAFLDQSLAALLAPGNIPALQHPERFRFLIRTSESDVPALRSAPEIARLRRYLGVDIKGFPDHLFTGGKTEDRYWRMSSLHREIIERCEANDAGIVFLPSDVIWGDGTIGNMEKLIDNGHRVIAMCTLRTDASRMEAPIRDAMENSATGETTIAISNRDLVRLSLNNLHAETLSRCVDADYFTEAPAHVYWRLGADGILARGVHLHPLYVHPRHYVTDFETTFDADFLSKAVPDPADYYVCDDSDLLYFTDLTSPDDTDTIPPEPASANIVRIAHWIEKHTDPPHRHFLNTPVWIHAGIDRSDWAAELENSEQFSQSARQAIEKIAARGKMESA